MDLIGTDSAVKRVVAVATEKIIIAGAAVEAIIRAAAGKGVVPATAVNDDREMTHAGIETVISAAERDPELFNAGTGNWGPEACDSGVCNDRISARGVGRV